MRSFTAILASASLVLSVLAAPDRQLKGIWGRNERSPAKRANSHESRSSTCMSDNEAQQVATNFKDLIVEYSDELANSSLTVDFVDYSDSVIELINSGCPDSVQAVSLTSYQIHLHEQGLTYHSSAQLHSIVVPTSWLARVSSPQSHGSSSIFGKHHQTPRHAQALTVLTGTPVLR